MKPTKSLEDITEVVRSLQERAYHLKRSDNVEAIQQIMLELAALNFSLSWYKVEYEGLYNDCETEYKTQVAQTFMAQKAEKKTDGASDNTARIEHRALRDEYNGYYKSFKLAWSLHDDVSTLIDVLRSKASSLKK